MDGPVVPEFRTKTIEDHKDITNFEDCVDHCAKNTECNSFIMAKGKKLCSLKKNKLNGSEPIVKQNKNFYSGYKICPAGSFDIFLNYLYYTYIVSLIKLT